MVTEGISQEATDAAHEVWAISQCGPGEGIQEASERVAVAMQSLINSTIERCAAVADDHTFGIDIGDWLVMTKKDVSAYACRSVATAIRQMKGSTNV